MGIRITDLKVQPREAPILMKVWNSPILHIVRAHGELTPEAARIILDHRPRYDITDCKRIIAHSGVATNLDILDGIRLCPSCGSQEDFEKALAEYWARRKKAERLRQINETTERMLRQAELDRQAALVETLLRSHGVLQYEIDGGVAKVSWGDQVYEVRLIEH